MSSTEPGSTVDQTKQVATHVRDEAASKAVDVAGVAKEQARSVVVDARDQAAAVIGTGRDALHAQAAEQAKTISTTLSELSDQLSTMADTSDEPDARVAEFARSAADTLARSARRLDSGGVDGLIDDVKRFARNRPGAFLIGSIAAGFAVGRLVKYVDVHKVVEQAKSEISDSDESASDSVSPRPTSPALAAAGTTALDPPRPSEQISGAQVDPGANVSTEVAELP